MILFPKSLPQTYKSYEIDGYTVELSSVDSINHLKQDWLRLEAQHNTPFFLCWHWISCWVKTYNPQITALIARYKNQTVAIGLFTISNVKRHSLIHSKQLRLNQIGKESMDQIWVEYNDFICDKSHQDDAVNACLKTLFDSDLEWDEIVMSMMPSSRASTITSSFPMASVDLSTPCYAVNLSEIRERKQDYLQSLTANTRYQVRRSMRLYEKEYGDLKIVNADDKESALNFFHEAGKYHIQRWANSGYKNPHFILFHENLIRDSFDNGSIRLISLNAGDETIAIVYYHIFDHQIFFYLQGLNYHRDQKYKPGLVAHVLATNFFLQQGMTSYNYMGGYSQYKSQLAKQTEGHATVIIQRPRSRFRIENMVRKIKRRIIRAEK